MWPRSCSARACARARETRRATRTTGWSGRWPKDSACRTSSLPLSRFGAALASGDVGDLNVVVPNNCDNGHDPCGGDPVRHFDEFLRATIPRIEASPALGRDGVIFVVWDEGSDRQPGHVAALVLGPRVRAGARDTRRYTHYGLERTLADGLGLRPLAHARTAAPITGIWGR